MPWLPSLCPKLAALLLIASVGYGAPAEFSHRQHAKFKLKCALCHKQTESSERAGFPAAQDCLTCHQTLSRHRLNPELLSWKRTPRLPDYVIFSHATHRKSEVECSTCHGDVLATDVPGRPLTLRMRSCMACHRQQKATVDCAACHLLRQ